MKIGILYKNTVEAKNLSKEIEHYLIENGNEVVFIDENVDLKDSIILSLGGDGTLLKAFQFAYKFDIPILGINLGGLGFLTDVEREDVFDALQKLINKNFSIENRKVLEGGILREGKKLKKYYAFNDFVISKEILSPIISLEIFIDGVSVSKVKGDGIIISSPNGSTAYSLSAGGPIVSPKCDVYILTTLCSHKLTSRPIVLSSKEKVSINVIESDGDVLFIEDGIKRENILKNDHLIFNVAERDAKLIRLKEKNFYLVVNSKFNWGT